MNPNPLDMPPEQFRQLADRVVAMVADYFRDLDQRPVCAPVTASACESLFVADPLPLNADDPMAIVEDVAARVLPNLATLGSPRHVAYVNGSGTPMSVLAEAIAATVNANAGAWKAGPAATEIERLLMRWLGEAFGYPAGGGVLTSGGTMANLAAVYAALCDRAPFDVRERGLQGRGGRGRLLLYIADHEGHSSVYRVAEMLGLGRDAVRQVPSRADFTMDPRALEELVASDLSRGDHPFCVVAQVGSINVGAIDPLDAMADVCARYGLWLHGDGACGAPCLMLPEVRERAAGVERLDSLSFDPHKSLFVSYDAGCLMIRDPALLRNAFSMNAGYLRGIIDNDYQGQDFLEYGPEMSRPFRALKVWMNLRLAGISGYRAILRNNIELVRHLDRRVRQHPDMRALHAPGLYLYSFQYRPAPLAGRESQQSVFLDRLNQEIAEAVQQSGLSSLMTTRVAGRVVLRVSVCSHRAREQDVDAIFDAIIRSGRRICREQGLPGAGDAGLAEPVEQAS